MNYNKIYNQIILKRQKDILSGCYYEKHHIIPRCLGGTNEKENLVKLTAREHYIAHKLLHKIHKNSKELAYALRMMMVKSPKNTRTYKVSARDYDRIKKECAINHSELLKQRKWFGDNANFKGHHHTEESKAKISRPGERSAWWGKVMSEQQKRKQSETMKGRYIGENNPFYGKIHTEESIRIMREKKIGKYTWNKVLLYEGQEITARDLAKKLGVKIKDLKGLLEKSNDTTAERSKQVGTPPSNGQEGIPAVI